MIYIFYISFLLKYNTVDEKVKKGMISVETIFPREENAEHIFEKILENEDACERLRELFYEEFANSGNRNLSEKQFVKALFDAYQNRDLSAFLMEICGNSMFDLLRNAFLIPIRFNDKGVINPVRLTDSEGELIKQIKVNKQISSKQYKMYKQILNQADDIPDYEVMTRVGLPVAPADAAPEIKEIAKYISSRRGGEGVARDVIEQTMRAQGHWFGEEAFGW